MSFTFRPAVREKVSLLVALAGPSGSGKTFSALRLARGIVGGDDSKIAFIDTEAGRASHYFPARGERPGPDKFGVLAGEIGPPFRPARFLEAVRAAEAAGAEVVVIDSFSHEYDGEGGIIDWADELAEGKPKPGVTNPRRPNSEPDWWKDWAEKPVPSPGNWKEPKLAHKKMLNGLLQCRASLIFCLRADEKIEIVRGERGKTEVRPLGWMPICEKRFMYEMTASFTLTADRPGRPRFDLPHKVQSQHRGFFPEDKPISEESGLLLARWARGEGDARSKATPAGSVSSQEPAGGADSTDPEQTPLVRSRAAAMQGTAAYEAFWQTLGREDRQALIDADAHKQNKAAAAEADKHTQPEKAA